MGIVEDLRYRPLLENDLDDYRPQSQLAFAIDPGQEDGACVHSISLLFEHCAAGDRVPLHTHTLDEPVVVDEGALELRWATNGIR